MKLRSHLPRIIMVRTMVRSRKLTAQKWAHVRVGAGGGRGANGQTGVLAMAALLVLLLGLSGCGERAHVETVLEWECGADGLSVFLQKQKLFQHDEAQEYCRSLTHGGKDDWRLPARHELMRFPLPAQELQPGTLLPDSRVTTCWSSTPYHDSRLRYWAVSVSNKQAAPLRKDARNAVICVRAECAP
ncbi:MAG: DUF1566 domain-containing protein [Desulfuromonas sp.]